MMYCVPPGITDGTVIRTQSKSPTRHKETVIFNLHKELVLSWIYGIKGCNLETVESKSRLANNSATPAAATVRYRRAKIIPSYGVSLSDRVNVGI